MLGTVGYMAPEQLRGQPADHRSDIFSFGAVLYEMLTGRRAFPRRLGDRDDERDPQGGAGGALRVGPRDSAGLERIVAHCLEKRPEERFQSARDLAFDLGSLSTPPPRSPLPEPASTGRSTRRRLAFAAIGTLGLVAAFWAGSRVARRPPAARSRSGG